MFPQVSPLKRFTILFVFLSATQPSLGTTPLRETTKPQQEEDPREGPRSSIVAGSRARYASGSGSGSASGGMGAGIAPGLCRIK